MSEHSSGLVSNKKGQHKATEKYEFFFFLFSFYYFLSLLSHQQTSYLIYHAAKTFSLLKHFWVLLLKVSFLYNIIIMLHRNIKNCAEGLNRHNIISTKIYYFSNKKVVCIFYTPFWNKKKKFPINTSQLKRKLISLLL